MNILIDRLHQQMEKENMDIHILEEVTYKGLYDNLKNGTAPEKDIADAAAILNCSMQYLTGEANTYYLLSDRVKGRFKSLKWDSNSFSDYTGLPMGSVSRYLNKNVHATPDTVMILAYGLNCSIQYLTGETDDPARVDKYKLPELYAVKRNMVSVDPNDIKSAINKMKVTPSKFAEMIHVPHVLLKRSMVDGCLPEYTAIKIHNVLEGTGFRKMPDRKKKEITPPVEESKFLDIKKKLEDMSTPLTRAYLETKTQKELDAEAVKELAAKIPQMYEDLKQKTVDASLPKNGYISTGQLLSLAIITDKHPELLKLFSQITELDESDYNKLYNTIQWMVDTLKK